MSSEKKGKKNNKSQVTWIKKYKLKLMQGTETKIKTTLHVCGDKICAELTISYHSVTVQE